jgi:hypothetical protein
MPNRFVPYSDRSFSIRHVDHGADEAKALEFEDFEERLAALERAEASKRMVR